MAARQASAAPEPLVLRGTPRRVSTTVSVHNATDAPVTVRAATLRSPGAGTSSARLAAVLPAGSTGDVPVSLVLAPTTAPGDYDAELEVAGSTRAAVLHVEPDVDLDVSPRRLLAAADGEPVRLRLTNPGNVPVPVAARVRARLWCDGVVTDLDVGLDLDEGVTVGPGLAVDAHGRLVVPDGLDPARRYRARVPVGVADLEVLVLPKDDDAAARAPRSSRSTTRPSRRTTTRKEQP